MSASSSELEVRYAHLLQPIRDLAQNWHIDLAQELEDYLHELDSTTVSVDPSPSLLSSSAPSSAALSSLNFAEAALLIQGSACVYSKKVEYLYSLLYATLDVVIAKHKKDAKKSSIDPLGQDGDWDGERDLPLLPLDDLPLSANVDLDESHCRSYSDERKSTLLHRLPPALSRPTGASVGQEKGGPLFRVSDCAVHASGALLLEGRDNALLDASLRRISSDAPFGSPAAVVKAHRASLGLAVLSAAAVSAELNFDDGGDDDVGGFEDAVAMQDSIPSDAQVPVSDDPASVSKPAKAVRFASDGHLCDYRRVQRSSITVDPYAVLDPFDSSVPVKPFKRGKTERVYKGNGQAALGSAGLFSDSAAYALVSSEIERGNVHMPSHAEFAAQFVRHVQRVKRQQRLKRKRDTDASAPSRSSSPIADPIDDEDTADLFDALPLDGGEDGWEEPDPSSTDELPAPLALDGDSSHFGRTFEELCREHLDAYLHSADEWLKSSEMTTKVREWQDKLEPILEEEDAHPTFDIQEYGDRMLGSLEQRKSDGDGQHSHSCRCHRRVEARCAHCQSPLCSTLRFVCSGRLRECGARSGALRHLPTVPGHSAAGQWRCRRHSALPAHRSRMPHHRLTPCTVFVRP